MADDAGRIEALYDLDGVAWAEQQAEALRRRAMPGELDWDNLAEEIEDVGKGIARACRSCIDRIIEHLLKLEFAPRLERERNRRGWRASVLKHRDLLEQELTPTLRRRLPDDLSNAYARQLRHLIQEGLLDDREVAEARARVPYTWTEITDEDWWPEPR